MTSDGWKKVILAALFVTFFFTLLDGIIHAAVEYFEIYYYPIPHAFTWLSNNPLTWYVIGKFIGTVIMSIILIPLISKMKANMALKTFIYTMVVISLLEFRYLLTGYYGYSWHLSNLIMHFFTLFIPAFIIFKVYKIFERPL